jgi:thioesterase domain-containing protein
MLLDRVKERAPSASASSSVVCRFNPQGTKMPVFCTHPVGGSVACYSDLATALGESQPLVALQAVGLAGEAEPLRTISAMATRALDEIRALRPEGPYALLGWSYGGCIAFEVACRLRAAGESPPLLVLADSWSPLRGFDSADAALDDARALAWLAASVYGASIGDPLAVHARLQGRPRGEAIDELDRLAREAGVRAPIPRDHLRHLLAVFQANATALTRYEPERYEGAAVFLRPTSRSADVERGIEALGFEGAKREAFAAHVFAPIETWQGLVGRLTVHDVPGDHYSMLAPPHVQALAEHVRSYLSASFSSREAAQC